MSRFWLLECFSCLGFQLFDALHRGQFFWHRAAEFLDGLAHFGTDFAVGFVGIVFASDLFAAEFFLGLGGAEEIGGQLGAAHVIEDLLALLQPFATVYVLGAKSSVESYVAVILEDGVVARFDDSGIFRRIGKLAVVGS